MFASLKKVASGRASVKIRNELLGVVRAYSSIEKAEFGLTDRIDPIEEGPQTINETKARDEDVVEESLEGFHIREKLQAENGVEDPLDSHIREKKLQDAVDDPLEDLPINENKLQAAEDNIPWYLRDTELSSDTADSTPTELPAVPQHAPASVSSFLNLLAVDYGLDNIQLFDLTVLDDTHDYHTSKQPAEYIIICTGKSEKHIFKAANELRTHIKHGYDHLPSIEGMVNSTQSPKARRRMLRRARKGPSATDNDYGKAPNSWVMCDTLVDNVFIHMLTHQRRQELNLESLWCKPEDLPKYTPQQKPRDDSDDIFIGIRRFHTATPFARNQSSRRLFSTSPASTELQDYYNEFCSRDYSSLSSDSTKHSVTEFDTIFGQRPASLSDHNTKRDFYKLVHLVDPQAITFDQVVDTILQKYNSLNVALDETIDLSVERTSDVTQYISLLIDSPTLKHHKVSAKITSDMLYDKLSKFISVLYRFSNDKFSLSANAKTIPLLWKLAFVADSPSSVLGSEQIDKVINEEASIPSVAPEPANELASNRARDVLSLIAYENSQSSHTNALIPAQRYREMLLFTYGNVGHWDKFWKEWDNSFNLSTVIDSKAKAPHIENWTRLAVYLAARNNKAQMLHFFNNYWDANSSLTGSFQAAFAANDGQFNSDSEKRAFTTAVTSMLRSVGSSSDRPVYPQIAQFLKSI